MSFINVCIQISVVDDLTIFGDRSSPEEVCVFARVVAFSVFIPGSIKRSWLCWVSTAAAANTEEVVNDRLVLRDAGGDVVDHIVFCLFVCFFEMIEC